MLICHTDYDQLQHPNGSNALTSYSNVAAGAVDVTASAGSAGVPTSTTSTSTANSPAVRVVNHIAAEIKANSRLGKQPYLILTCQCISILAAALFHYSHVPPVTLNMSYLLANEGVVAADVWARLPSVVQRLADSAANTIGLHQHDGSGADAKTGTGLIHF